MFVWIRRLQVWQPAKKPAKSLIIFASKSKTTYRFLLFDLEKNIPIKIVWSLTLQFFQTCLKLVTKNPNFSLEVGRFWWIFLMMGNNNFPQKSPLDMVKGILTAMLFFFRNPTSLIQNLKTRINFFSKKYGFTSKNDFSGLDRNFVKSAGKFLLIVQDLFIRIKNYSKCFVFSKTTFPQKASLDR